MSRKPIMTHRRLILRIPVFVSAFLLLGAVGPPAAWAQAQIPEGYEVVRLTDDLGMHSRPDINDRGDVVWSSSFPPEESDVFLFANGIIRRITDDEWYDVHPVINNNRVVVWTRGDDWSYPFEIVYDDGEGVHVVPDPGGITPIGSADINDPGQIVWSQRLGVEPSWDEVFLFDGEVLEQISNNGLSNQSPRINRLGDIVWTRYDFEVFPWVGTIMLRLGEDIIELTDGSGEAQVPDINDMQQVVWTCGYGCPTIGIHLWERGVVTNIVGDGSVPRINIAGLIAFNRFDPASEKWGIWLYDEGALIQVSDPLYWSTNPNINTRGEVVWRTKVNTFGDTAISFMRLIRPKGDLNGDCRIDAIDYRAFQICYTGSDQGPPGGLLGNCTRADFDEDGDVDEDDFAGFLGTYTGPGGTLPGCKP